MQRKIAYWQYALAVVAGIGFSAPGHAFDLGKFVGDLTGTTITASGNNNADPAPSTNTSGNVTNAANNLLNNLTGGTPTGNASASSTSTSGNVTNAANNLLNNLTGGTPTGNASAGGADDFLDSVLNGTATEDDSSGFGSMLEGFTGGGGIATGENNPISDLLDGFGSDLAAGTGSSEGGAIGSVLCQIVNWLMGSVGSAIATMGVIVLGMGALMGKVSQAAALTTCVGVSVIFGAPQIVYTLTGYAGCYGMGGTGLSFSLPGGGYFSLDLGSGL